MNRIYVQGLGAVSPAGWGVEALYSAVTRGVPVPPRELSRPGWDRPLLVRPVDPPAGRLEFLAHPRLRRVSILTQYVAAAGLEALSPDAEQVHKGDLRLGIIVCLLAGCVTYSRRFFEEVMQDPKTASPLLFPETVYNAPASHLAAMLGSNAISYTLVGDECSFLQALPMAAAWILSDRADACLVIGAEEMDWISADATHLFARRVVNSAGAGALYLRAVPNKDSVAELSTVTDPVSCAAGQTRPDAVREVRRSLPTSTAAELLCLSTHGAGQMDRAEEAAWGDWTGRLLAPKAVLGEAFTAAAAWECIVACESLRRKIVGAANVSVVGAGGQAMGARFVQAAAE